MSKINKLDLFTYGVSRARLFCEANNLPIPRSFTNRKLTRNTGFYDPNTTRIVVDVSQTASPVEKPHHMCWSWPAFKTDRTAVGVPCHETGHHVQYVMMKNRKWDRSWAILAVNTPKITSYEPVPSEAFAETMRLFILNPFLLRHYSPKRYAFITDVLELRPIELRDAYEVVGNPNYNNRITQLIGD